MTNADIKELINSCREGANDGEISLLIEHIAIIPDDRQESLWHENIIEASQIIKKNKGLLDAIKMLQDTYKSWPIHYPSSYAHKTDILKTLCHMQIEAKQYSHAHHTMNRYIYNALKQVSANTPLSKMHYFSFRSFSDYALEDIKEERISLTHPRDFNDPLDTILTWWLENQIQIEKDEAKLKYKLIMKKSVEHIKIRCMIGSKYTNNDGVTIDRTIEDLSVLMWAHYANGHTGFCVEYDLEDSKLHISGVEDENKVDLIKAIKYVPLININDAPSMEIALFHKSDFWAYENEMRLCSFDATSNEEHPTIGCKGAIKAIYLGAKCSEINRRKMEQAIADKDIPLYQMSVDITNLTRFKKMQIG